MWIIDTQKNYNPYKVNFIYLLIYFKINFKVQKYLNKTNLYKRFGLDIKKLKPKYCAHWNNIQYFSEGVTNKDRILIYIPRQGE